MVTFFDLIQNNEFRDFVFNRVSHGTGSVYEIPSELPRLYKYRPLSSYAIEDIVNGKVTLTSVGEFNDIFDGAMHLYGTKEEIERIAEEKCIELEAHLEAAHFPKGFLKHEDIVEQNRNHLKLESRLTFRELDYLGTYVCCFSRNNASTLMWSHYADSNRGCCIEYDFNRLPENDLLRQSLFPIAYTQSPIALRDLLEDKNNQLYQYSLDAAVLCSALNKASVWKYEQEWRIVWVLSFSDKEIPRIPIDLNFQPSKVYLGYHFMKPFFFYNYDKKERDKCAENLKKTMELISFLQKHNIPVAIMIPSIGGYHFKPTDIRTDELATFLKGIFKNNRPESIRYYYVFHDRLMDLLE